MWKVFDYKCENCDLIVEKLIRDDEEVICDECGEKMARYIAGPAYHQTIVSYLESAGRSVPRVTVPEKPKRWV